MPLRNNRAMLDSEKLEGATWRAVRPLSIGSTVAGATLLGIFAHNISALQKSGELIGNASDRTPVVPGLGIYTSYSFNNPQMAEQFRGAGVRPFDVLRTGFAHDKWHLIVPIAAIPFMMWSSEKGGVFVNRTLFRAGSSEKLQMTRLGRNLSAFAERNQESPEIWAGRIAKLETKALMLAAVGKEVYDVVKVSGANGLLHRTDVPAIYHHISPLSNFSIYDLGNGLVALGVGLAAYHGTRVLMRRNPDFFPNQAALFKSRWAAARARLAVNNARRAAARASVHNRRVR